MGRAHEERENKGLEKELHGRAFEPLSGLLTPTLDNTTNEPANQQRALPQESVAEELDSNGFSSELIDAQLTLTT